MIYKAHIQYMIKLKVHQEMPACHLAQALIRSNDEDSRNQRNLRVKITQAIYLYQVPIAHRIAYLLLSVSHPSSQYQMS